jgi:uncharacterized protein (DUF1778 family)
MASSDDTSPNAQRGPKKPRSHDGAGNVRKPPKDRMRIAWRTDEREEIDLKKAAAYLHIPVTTFVRSMALQAAHHIIGQHELHGVENHIGFDVPLMDAPRSFDPPTSHTTERQQESEDDAA